MPSFYRHQGLPALTLALFLLLTLAACGAAAPPPQLDWTLRIANGGMTPDTVAVRQGDTITARLESDRAGVVHFHGYDLERAVTAGATAELQFTANATGRFPITFHETAAAGGGGEHSHDHSAKEPGPLESTVPVNMDLTAEVDPAGGLHIRIATENWQWAPEEVNQESRPGVGHAHIYANGEKLSRIYGPEHYVADLPPGRYEIRVDLNDNAHNALTVNGAPLAATTAVTIPTQAAAAIPADPEPIAAASPMSLELRAHPDAPGGYNLQVIPAGFAFGSGQGYGLLSLDGTSVTRLYTAWLQLPPLEPGMHTVSVALRNGDGRPYHWQGQPVAAAITVVEDAPDDGMNMAMPADGGHNHETAVSAAGGESGELELGFLVVTPR